MGEFRQKQKSHSLGIVQTLHGLQGAVKNTESSRANHLPHRLGGCAVKLALKWGGDENMKLTIHTPLYSPHSIICRSRICWRMSSFRSNSYSRPCCSPGLGAREVTGKNYWKIEKLEQMNRAQHWRTGGACTRSASASMCVFPPHWRPTWQ